MIFCESYTQKELFLCEPSHCAYNLNRQAVQGNRLPLFKKKFNVLLAKLNIHISLD